LPSTEPPRPVTRSAAEVPNHRDRVVLKDTGWFVPRRDDAATIEQVIAGIPGKPR